MKPTNLTLVTPDQQRIDLDGSDIHEFVAIQLLAGVLIAVDYEANTIYQLKHGWRGRKVEA